MTDIHHPLPANVDSYIVNERGDAGNLLADKCTAILNICSGFGVHEFAKGIECIAAGIVLGILLGYLLRYQFPGGTEKLTPSLIFFLPTQQLVFAGLVEEPFFRGFLWGALRKSGWKDLWILIFQTVLFMIGHLYYLGGFPISFWIVVLFGGLVTGLLAWRSRSIATSMVGHGFLNAVGQMVAYYRF